MAAALRNYEEVRHAWGGPGQECSKLVGQQQALWEELDCLRKDVKKIMRADVSRLKQETTVQLCSQEVVYCGLGHRLVEEH